MITLLKKVCLIMLNLFKMGKIFVRFYLLYGVRLGRTPKTVLVI